MKLDKIKFARVIAYVSQLMVKYDGLSAEHVEDIDRLIDIYVEPVKIPLAPVESVNELLREIINPDGFINAIKAYRSLTGASLKESKDAVEKYRSLPSFRHSEPKDVTTGATLGDILGKATNG